MNELSSLWEAVWKAGRLPARSVKSIIRVKSYLVETVTLRALLTRA